MSHMAARSPYAADARLVCGKDSDEVVSLCVIGSRPFTRMKFVRGTALILNGFDLPGNDLTYIEYNDLLVAPGSDAALLFREMLNQLATAWPRRWDEFLVPGVSDDAHIFDELVDMPEAPVLGTIEIDDSASYVDLATIRADGGDYIASRSRNTRQQLRRALRGYEQIGPLVLEVADSPARAQEIFDELVELHQAHWTELGQAGSFSSPDVRNAHRDLIGETLDTGTIQLLRVTAGDQPVGCLYNFIERGHVQHYSSGLCYTDDRKLRPGWVTHYLAIQQSLDDGYDVYDFLAGPSQFKTSLSNGNRPMIWARLQRPRLRFRAERFANQLRGKGSAEPDEDP